jgi:hypothetical protein
MRVRLAAVYSGAPKDVTPSERAGPLAAVQAADDRFNDTIRSLSAWNKAKLPAEMHIYGTGEEAMQPLAGHSLHQIE